MTQTTSLALEYAKMNQWKVQLEDQLKAHKEEMKAIEAQLKEQFISDGVSSIKTSLGLVFLHKQIWARCPNPLDLHGTGWDFLVNPTVNSNSLSAAVRELELDQNGQPSLPEEVKDYVDVSEVWSVRVRGNGNSN